MSEDFSQTGEQAMILEWADRRPSKGHFLDLGAADGISASNVRALALRGWSGTAVECGAVQFDKLAHLYSERPDIECVQAAVIVDPDPLVRFWYSHDLVSTTDEASRDVWSELSSFVPIYVATVTVEQLLAVCPGPYDMASIDVEGTSLETLDELVRLDAFAPGALVVVECQNGTERRLAQAHCLDGFHRVGVTPNNLLFTNGPA